ncbi:MAG: NAD-dependent dehydratase, partial [Actinobacteria bacterium]|nr:NAD-dependent dehydratase [Actinomycetota bacterium]
TEVERISGRRRVELPAGVALATAERLHRLGLSSASPRDLDHLLAPIVVTSERLRALGWGPSWTNEAALRAHLAERDAHGSGRAGAYTAAGASVALLGTAALVRQARRRRRRL